MDDRFHKKMKDRSGRREPGCLKRKHSFLLPRPRKRSGMETDMNGYAGNSGDAKGEQKKAGVYWAVLYVIFGVYVIMLAKVILFKYTSVGRVAEMLLAGELDGFRSLNLIPFRTIEEFVKIGARGAFWRSFSNIAGNVCIFAPLGYFLPLLWKPFRRFWRVMLTALGVSLFFEVSQYVCYLGSADVDDLLLNTLGACLGYGCYCAVRKLAGNRRLRLYRVTAALSVVCFAVCLAVAVDQFGIMLGIRGGDTVPVADTGDLNSGEILVEGENVGGGRTEEAAQEDELWGDILSFTEDGFIVNVITVNDFGNGVGTAVSGQGEHMVIRQVRLEDATVYTKKEIYDMNGNHVEENAMTRNDLEKDRTVHMKGRTEDGVFVAESVEMDVFVFME